MVTCDYYRRYNLPVMQTETNKEEPDAERWLWKIWSNIQRLRQDGVPVCGMTWYSLTDQVDWDTALREDRGCVNPLGLYDLDRKIRPVEGVQAAHRRMAFCAAASKRPAHAGGGMISVPPTGACEFRWRERTAPPYDTRRFH